ncbi:MAG: class I SAM-dependent methyltransferase [Rhodospirillales bacterium]|nr:class I SAM-dependent methyltransferase [Rhodospirillales bacterium]
MSSQDSFYSDILRGLAVYFDSRFVSDIRDTAARFPDPALGYALNRNQMTSKQWLVNTLLDVTGGDLGRVCIVGGWYGVLGAMLLHDKRFSVESVCSVDRDRSCREIADSLNRTHVDSGKFKSLTADMLELDYGNDYDVVVNTSCEHLPNLGDWLKLLPDRILLALQSNDYYGIEGHVNCVNDLDAFKRQAPLAIPMFEGQKKIGTYTRFMLIGRK